MVEENITTEGAAVGQVLTMLRAAFERPPAVPWSKPDDRNQSLRRNH